MKVWMSGVLRVSGAVAILAGVSAGLAADQRGGNACRPSASLVRVAELPEASGLALSRRTPDHLWTHNDSGEPMLFSLDGKGALSGQVRITGAGLEDWEAISVAACGEGSCLYIGDIGDNDAERKRVTVYRVPEPEPKATSAAVDAVFHLSFPDGSHDAEALLMTPDGGMFIVTKGDTGAVALYRAPRDLKPGGTARLERVGRPLTPDRAPNDFRITDGAVSPDGEWVALRTRASLMFYRAEEFLQGNWREVRRVDLAPLGEPQGEGIALGAGNTVYLAGEGGGKGRAGTLATFTCAPGR